MFRHQFHVQLQLGKFRDFYATFEEFDKVVRTKNLVAPQLWAKSFGNVNGVVVVRDYESIAAWDVDNRAFLADADCMNLWRKLSQYADGIPWDELWETAPQIA